MDAVREQIPLPVCVVNGLFYISVEKNTHEFPQTAEHC